jgi:hypothetical protein
MNVPSTSPPKGASSASLVYTGKNKVRYFLNTPHTLWGSCGTNPRRESFMEYLVSLNLDILNQGNKPSFVVHNRKLIDLTLAANKIGNLVTGMYPMSHVCQTSYICFQTGNTAITQVTFRDTKKKKTTTGSHI